MNFLIIGAGFTGLTAARCLVDQGHHVQIIEASHHLGGAARSEILHGIHYEPNGPHIFHTDNERVIEFTKRFVRFNGYEHRVSSITSLGTLSWPPQIGELRQSRLWPQISEELEKRPETPTAENFEDYAIELMGRTLYEVFIKEYTEKQWNKPVYELSSSFAPKRIDLREDGDTRLFRDAKLQGWPVGGWSEFAERIGHGLPVSFGESVTLDTCKSGGYAGVIVTAPLDQFMEEPRLAWRGVRWTHSYEPKAVHVLPTGVVNTPLAGTPFTRMIETKIMEAGPWESELPGTIVSYEYPGADAKHYPVADVHGDNRRHANELITRLESLPGNFVAAGRLAQYVYIDTDQAINMGMKAARRVLDGVL